MFGSSAQRSPRGSGQSAAASLFGSASAMAPAPARSSFSFGAPGTNPFAGASESQTTIPLSGSNVSGAVSQDDPDCLNPVAPYTVIYTDGKVKTVRITGTHYTRMAGVTFRRLKDACSRCLWYISRCDLASAITWSRDGHVLAIPRCEKAIGANLDKCGRCLAVGDKAKSGGICMKAVGSLRAKACTWEKTLSLFAKSGGDAMAWSKLIDAQKDLAEVIKVEEARKTAAEEKKIQEAVTSDASTPKKPSPANESNTATSSEQLLGAVTGVTGAISALQDISENTMSISVGLESIAMTFTQFAADYRVVHQATLQAHTLGSIECDEADVENTAGDSEMDTEV